MPEQQAAYLIFDMDGVIVDSNPFHKMAWKTFCEKNGCHLTEDELRMHIYGKTNEDALGYLFGKTMTDAEAQALAEQKEELYRELFRPHLTAVSGLMSFLEKARLEFKALAVATSAPPDNVDFVLDTLNLRSFFSVVVDETQVTQGKPHPEIYLKAAQALDAHPQQCIVFEDSLSGIQSARDADMTVFGITTTHSLDELLPRVDGVIQDFTRLSVDSSSLYQALERRIPANHMLA